MAGEGEPQVVAPNWEAITQRVADLAVSASGLQRDALGHQAQAQELMTQSRVKQGELDTAMQQAFAALVTEQENGSLGGQALMDRVGGIAQASRNSRLTAAYDQAVSFQAQLVPGVKIYDGQYIYIMREPDDGEAVSPTVAPLARSHDTILDFHFSVPVTDEETPVVSFSARRSDIGDEAIRKRLESDFRTLLHSDTQFAELERFAGQLESMGLGELAAECKHTLELRLRERLADSDPDEDLLKYLAASKPEMFFDLYNERALYAARVDILSKDVTSFMDAYLRATSGRDYSHAPYAQRSEMMLLALNDLHRRGKALLAAEAQQTAPPNEQ